MTKNLYSCIRAIFCINCHGLGTSVTVGFSAVATVTVGFACVSLRGTVTDHRMRDDKCDDTFGEN